MTDYDFINDLIQIRGVDSIKEHTPNDRPEIIVNLNNLELSEEDLDKVYSVLKNQNVVKWTVNVY